MLVVAWLGFCSVVVWLCFKLKPVSVAPQRQRETERDRASEQEGGRERERVGE